MVFVTLKPRIYFCSIRDAGSRSIGTDFGFLNEFCKIEVRHILFKKIRFFFERKEK